jgi:hypothetical protein
VSLSGGPGLAERQGQRTCGELGFLTVDVIDGIHGTRDLVASGQAEARSEMGRGAGAGRLLG